MDSGDWVSQFSATGMLVKAVVGPTKAVLLAFSQSQPFSYSWAPPGSLTFPWTTSDFEVKQLLYLCLSPFSFKVAALIILRYRDQC